MQKTRLYRVYWIYTEGMSDYKTQGYVGVTKNSIFHRLGQHLHSKRPVGYILRELKDTGIDIKVVELFRGTKEEALDKEYELRPNRYIGWNIQAGGNRSTVVCSNCGKYLPKGYSNSKHLCTECNDYDGKFTKGNTPHNYGKGEKYLLIDPDGNEYRPEVFTLFCKEHNLTPQNLRKVAKGTRKHHKQWKAIKL